MTCFCAAHGTVGINKAKADFFDAQANAQWASDNYTLEEMEKIEKVLAALPDLDGMTILEPGCGTGRLTRILSKQTGKKGKVVSFDISPKMIRNAEKVLAEADNVELHCNSLESLKLKQAGFDCVFCHQVFPHFDCKPTALKIMAQALKPGGILIILHLIGMAKINDVHRKAGTAVARDLMPDNRELKQLLAGHCLELEHMKDLEDLYFVLARKR
ncbi:MAG: class I SAM-dependent methyltransferase [Desulfonatronovibrio sp.]